jgi:hypothetical protein
MKHVSKLNHGCLVYGVVYVANIGIFSDVFCRRVHDKWRSVYMECIIHWLYLFQICLVFSHHVTSQSPNGSDPLCTLNEPHLPPSHLRVRSRFA